MALLNHIKSLSLPAANYGTSGLAQWIQDNVVTVVILLLAVAVLWAARAGNIAKGITKAGAIPRRCDGLRCGAPKSSFTPTTPGVIERVSV